MIACIVLASGFGRRFGGNKLLEPVEGKPLYRHVLDQLAPLHGGGRTVLVVTQYPEVEAAAQALGLQVCWNPDAAEGISASIRHGVAALPEADWYSFFVADQPNLKGETAKNFLIQAICSGKTLASVTAQGRPGNPTAFSRIWREDLLALRGDVGGRRILKAHPQEVFWYEVPPEELWDVDTPSALESHGKLPG